MDLPQVRFEGRPSFRSQPLTARRVLIPPARPGAPRVAGPTPRRDGVPALVLARAGLDPACYRAGPIERRLPACLRALKAATEPAARERLASHPALLEPALSAVLIGVSGFFRDEPVFESLGARVVPALAARGRPPRVLSLGCSTGAELYSVAMLLADARLLAGAELVGIDCRPDAIARARAGVYSTGELAGVGAGRFARHFAPARSGARVAEPLRRATRWRVADATRELAAGPWDLVLCRNLFIYLQPAVADAIFEGIVAALPPGGFLVVGKAERPPGYLPLTAVARSVYGRHAD